MFLLCDAPEGNRERTAYPKVFPLVERALAFGLSLADGVSPPRWVNLPKGIRKMDAIKRGKGCRSNLLFLQDLWSQDLERIVPILINFLTRRQDYDGNATPWCDALWGWVSMTLSNASTARASNFFPA